MVIHHTCRKHLVAANKPKALETYSLVNGRNSTDMVLPAAGGPIVIGTDISPSKNPKPWAAPAGPSKSKAMGPNRQTKHPSLMSKDQHNDDEHPEVFGKRDAGGTDAQHQESNLLHADTVDLWKVSNLATDEATQSRRGAQTRH